MEVIKNYLDNVFAAYPQTSEVQALKRDMLANMEEKYTMLRQGGKSEHEAAYSVIADFGNIEEITTELGLDIKNEEPEESISLSWDEAQNYLAKSKKSGIWIGLGVWLIIAGVSSFAAHTPFFYNQGMVIMFSSIAIAVVMFIINDSRMEKFKTYGETTINLDPQTRTRIEIQKSKFTKLYTASLCLGIVVILFSVLLMTGEVASINFSPSLFLVNIGFSVFLFVSTGCYNSAYMILLGKGEYSNKEASKKSGQIIGTIAAVYWPVATAIGIWQLFIGNAYFWVVWPVAGILFGGICGGISVWFGMKDKEKNGLFR